MQKEKESDLRTKVNEAIGFIKDMFGEQPWFGGSEPLDGKSGQVFIVIFVDEINDVVKRLIPDKFNGFTLKVRAKKGQ